MDMKTNRLDLKHMYFCGPCQFPNLGFHSCRFLPARLTFTGSVANTWPPVFVKEEEREHEGWTYERKKYESVSAVVTCFVFGCGCHFIQDNSSLATGSDYASDGSS
ncbi:hypothetical protein MUK42_35444 [Musa troglodytarum]|uniref:Uncharacterized protein n=1 Tax=Musa troglodytarum TaxID=320322 RepID=A0A9E7KDA8_9LILI|nr:hypothetical protein MUK42_35444 [Musa troglodytarum]URE16118.1 hypothetical protein MUK42_35444 [Musa troglodytarum]